MECTECATDGATAVTVEYTNGHTETLPLCADCQEAFERGGFVERVAADG